MILETAIAVFRTAFDRFPNYVVDKLHSLPESDAAGWIIAVKLKDGRVIRNVAVGDGFLGFGHFVHLFGNPGWKLPFRLHDVIDIEWEGHRIGKMIVPPKEYQEAWKFSANPA